MEKKEQYILQSADNTLAVLELFREYEELGSSEVAAIMGIGKSTAFRLLSTLENRRYLIKLPNNKYGLGIKLFSLGQIVKKRLSIKNVIHPYLLELSKISGETTHLVVWYDELNVIFIDKVLSSAAIRMDSYEGFILPAYFTGSGKALLSTLPDDKVYEYARNTKFVQRMPNTINSAARLYQEIDIIRQKGYALDNEESEPGLFCLAVPLVDKMNITQCAVSISGPALRMKENLEGNIELILRMSQDISKEL